MIKGKSRPLSWILKIPIYHNQLLNCKINAECNMLSMQLSPEGGPGSMTATQLGWPVMETQRPHRPLRGHRCSETPAPGAGDRGSPSAQITDSCSRPFCCGAEDNMWFHLGEQNDLSREPSLLISFKSSAPVWESERVTKLLGEGPAYLFFYSGVYAERDGRVCLREQTARPA